MGPGVVARVQGGGVRSRVLYLLRRLPRTNREYLGMQMFVNPIYLGMQMFVNPSSFGLVRDLSIEWTSSPCIHE